MRGPSPSGARAHDVDLSGPRRRFTLLPPPCALLGGKRIPMLADGYEGRPRQARVIARPYPSPGRVPAAVPPSAFYFDAATAPLLARFCFAKRLDTIAEARTRLQKAFG